MIFVIEPCLVYIVFDQDVTCGNKTDHKTKYLA